MRELLLLFGGYFEILKVALVDRVHGEAGDRRRCLDERGDLAHPAEKKWLWAVVAPLGMAKRTEAVAWTREGIVWDGIDIIRVLGTESGGVGWGGGCDECSGTS